MVIPTDTVQVVHPGARGDVFIKVGSDDDIVPAGAEEAFIQARLLRHMYFPPRYARMRTARSPGADFKFKQSPPRVSLSD
jgi:hypothetical protein